VEGIFAVFLHELDDAAMQVFFRGRDFSSSSTGQDIADGNTLRDLMTSSGFDGEVQDFSPENNTMRVRHLGLFISQVWSFTRKHRQCQVNSCQLSMTYNENASRPHSLLIHYSFIT
jgi:hypothetical protein